MTSDEDSFLRYRRDISDISIFRIKVYLQKYYAGMMNMDSNNVGQVSISVIVAAYNVSKFIRECLESLISQTEQFAEFVVVDDASTDGTEKICDEYEKKDSRIRIVRHKENKGSLAARKSGIEKAKGRYITFLDGDDIFTRQDALSLLADQMNKEGCDIGVFGVVLLGEAGIRRSGLV